MSSVKLSRKNKPYFNLSFETANNVVYNAVCFSQSKRTILDQVEKEQNGICIEHAKKSGDGTLLLNESTSIKQEKLGFNPTYNLPTKTVHEIINKVSINSNITMCVDWCSYVR